MHQRLMAVIFSVALLTGCAQLEVIKATGQGRAPELLIASDLVNALMQAEGFHPTSTRLQMRTPKHRFGKTLQRVLMSAGYDIQKVDARIGDRFVDYAYSNRKQSVINGSQTYQVNVGHLGVKRDYVVQNGEVRPDSDLLISGVDAAHIALNDQIFTQAKPVKSTPRDIKRPDRPDTQPIETTSNLEMFVNGEPSPRNYSAGENIVLTVKSATDARLSCYYQDPDSNVMRIFPNRFIAESTLAAGDVIRIPAANDWSIEASKSGFDDKILCISVHPTLDAVMLDYEKSPDLEPLEVASLEELLSDLTGVIGQRPQNKQLSISVK